MSPICPQCSAPLVSPLRSLVFSSGKYSALRYACVCGWSGTTPKHTPASTETPAALTEADIRRIVREEVGQILAKETRKQQNTSSSGVNRLPRFFGTGREEG